VRALGAKLTHAVVLAGLLCGFAASPALADHDHDKHWRKQHWSERRSDWRPRHHYRDYDRHYYYYSEPRVEYYSSPRLYVPVPPPPSFGLNLVFPIH
jgi:hypothetical protein